MVTGPAECMIPVFNSTSAIEEMQHREGSKARKPHSSSRSKPLKSRSAELHIEHGTHTDLIQSISIRCCSATLFSLCTFLCSAVKIFRFSMRYLPDRRLTSSKASVAIPCSFVVAFPSLGGIEKYSSSSRRTMMACFVSRGFCEFPAPKSEDGEPSIRCCWAANRPDDVAVP